MLKWFAVLVATALLDAIWGHYIRANAERERLKAASCAAALVLFGALYTVSLVGDPWLVIPASLGAFVGTWWACR